MFVMEYNTVQCCTRTIEQNVSIVSISSWVQMTPMKFMAVKSVPSITGLVMCLQTIKDWVNGALLILKVQVI